MRETKFKQTEAGIIPIDWNTGSLSELFEFGNGYTPSKAVGEYWNNGNIPWFRVEDIRSNGNVLNDSLQHITPLAVKGELFPSNSFIISTSATVGEYAYVTVPYLANQRFVCLIKKHDIIDDGYFLSLCQVLGQWCRDNCDQGSSFVSVNMPNFRNHEIPLPPLAEQRKIAKALSDVDGLISSLTKLIEKKQNIKTATMQQLLTGKKRLEGFTEPWVEKRIEEVVTRFATGLNPRQNFVLNNGGLNYYVTIKNFRNGRIFLDDECDKIDDVALALINNRSDLKKGDLLLSSIGRVGDPCIVKSDPVNWNINESVFALRPNKELITVDFLYYIFTSDDMKRKINDSSTGSTLTSIKMGHLKELSINMAPSLYEQTAITNILTDMDNEISALETKKAKYESIKKGMMQELLTGRIRLV